MPMLGVVMLSDCMYIPLRGASSCIYLLQIDFQLAGIIAKILELPSTLYIPSRHHMLPLFTRTSRVPGSSRATYVLPLEFCCGRGFPNKVAFTMRTGTSRTVARQDAFLSQKQLIGNEWSDMGSPRTRGPLWRGLGIRMIS